MMKDKGQVLAIFIIVMPILLIILLLTIEVGINYNKKKMMENVTKNSIEYYLNHPDDGDIESKINNLILKNINNLKKKNIFISNHYIKIELEYEYKTLLSGFIKEKVYNIKTSYIGYFNEDKQVIEKE